MFSVPGSSSPGPVCPWLVSGDGGLMGSVSVVSFLIQEAGEESLSVTRPGLN